MRKIGLLLITLSLLLTDALLSSGSAAQADSHYFPETGITVSGNFLRYWQTNGGLTRFGYPLSEEMYITSDIDGKQYKTEYFERAVFEYHPENQPPNDVLLALLGRLRYNQMYPNSALNQQASATNPYRFAATGMVIGGAFRAYWERNGGLTQFGYPISNEFQEVSTLDGKSYTVQYFERAEFELHPENQPPYDVLLTQLGKFYYEEHSKLPTATPFITTPLPVTPGYGCYCGPRPTPNQSIDSGPVDITPDYSVVRDIVGAGHYIFQRIEQPTSRIYGYDLETHTAFDVDSQDVWKTRAIKTDGLHLIWAIDNSVISYDLITHRRYTIAQDVSTTTNSLALIGGTAYYAKADDQIYAYNFSTGQESRLVNPDGKLLSFLVDKGNIVWDEQVSKNKQAEYRLRLLEPGVSAAKIVATQPLSDFLSYKISGDNIMWHIATNYNYIPRPGDFADGSYGDLYLYRISTGEASSLASAVYTYDLNGSIAVWAQQGDNPGLYLHDTNKAATSSLVSANNSHFHALVKDNWVVWLSLARNFDAEGSACNDPFFYPSRLCFHSTIFSYNLSNGLHKTVSNPTTDTVDSIDVVTLLDNDVLAFIEASGEFYRPDLYIVRLR